MATVANIEITTSLSFAETRRTLEDVLGVAFREQPTGDIQTFVDDANIYLESDPVDDSTDVSLDVYSASANEVTRRLYDQLARSTCWGLRSYTTGGGLDAERPTAVTQGA